MSVSYQARFSWEGKDWVFWAEKKKNYQEGTILDNFEFARLDFKTILLYTVLVKKNMLNSFKIQSDNYM